MAHSIGYWKRISVSISILTMLLCLCTYVHAQVQPNSDATARIQTLNAIQDANDHYYQKRYTEAIRAYEVLLKSELSQTQRDSMRLMLGQSYAKLGQDAEARTIFKEIVDENPDGSYATQAVHQLSYLYSRRYQYKEAIILCNQILQQHPDTAAAAIAAYLTAYYQYVEGDLEKAMESYKHFLDKYPNSIYRTTAISSLVRLYTKNERYADAEELIRNRMKLNPTDTSLLEELANLYQQQGKSQEAIELFRNALEKNPANSSMRRKLGSLYAELGNKEQAIAEWKKLVAGDYDEHQQLGAIYLSHKMYTEAIKSFQQAIQKNPRYGYLYVQLADAYKIKADIEKAASTYLDGLQSVGSSGSQRETIWKAMLEIYQGDRQKHLRDKLIMQYERVYHSSPQNLNYGLTLGELYFYDEQHEQTLNIYTKLHKFYFSSIDAALGRFADDLVRNQSPLAADYFNTILQNSRDLRILSNTRYKLAKLYTSTEQWDNAVILLKEINKNQIASIDSQILLARIQLHGLRDPKAAQISLQPLLTQNLPYDQLMEANMLLGECHLLLKRWTLARQVLEPITSSLSRIGASAQKLIGDSYFFATEFDNALTEYHKVIHVSKSDDLTNDALERIVLIQDNNDFLALPLTDYANALQLFLNGEIDAAITQCEDTIAVHPKAMIVDDMWMLLGRIYRSQNAIGDALHSYKQIVSQESPLAADALTQIADIYRIKKDYTNAHDTYTTLLTTYPDNSIVPHVRQQLDEITKLMKNGNPNTP